MGPAATTTEAERLLSEHAPDVALHLYAQSSMVKLGPAADSGAFFVAIVRRALTKSDSLNGPLVSDRAIRAASGTALILGPALRRGAFFVLGRPAGIYFRVISAFCVISKREGT